MIGPPPNPVTIDGKEWFPAEPMKQHLRDLREALARCEFARDDYKRRLAQVTESFTAWKLQATRPK